MQPNELVGKRPLLLREHRAGDERKYTKRRQNKWNDPFFHKNTVHICRITASMGGIFDSYTVFYTVVAR